MTEKKLIKSEIKGEWENTKKIKVLMASDGPETITGFAKQFKAIAEYLGKHLGLEVHYIGWNTYTRPMYIQNLGFTLYPTTDGGKFASDAYIHLIKKHNPDVLITLGDEHMIRNLIHLKERPFWLGYFPVDGHPLNEPMKHVFNKMDGRLAMSFFGQQVCKESNLNPTYYVPHVFRKEHYYPKDKTEARKNLKFPTDKFIVGSVARLNPRKHQMRLIAAFAKFAKDKDDVFLYLNFDTKDNFFFKEDSSHDYMFEELMETISEAIGLENMYEKIGFATDFHFLTGLPEEEMADLYSSFDVHALSTGGEGFGVPTIEAMACGVPSIITDYTTSRELIADEVILDKDGNEILNRLPIDKHRGILVKPKKLYQEKSGVHKAWVDIDAFTEALETYYQSWKNPEKNDILEKHSKNCIEHSERYEFEYVMEKYWKSLIQYVTTNTEIITNNRSD